MTEALKYTPLYQKHVDLGAKIVPFGGWNMPVQYADGILAEHHHTRTRVSLFDCSHMGQLRVCGPHAAEELERLLPREIISQKDGICRYNFLLTDQGTVVDDLLVYRISDDEFYLVVNAGTTPGDIAFLRARLSPATTLTDESAETAKLDIQGPATFEVMAALGWEQAELPRYYRFISTTVRGVPCILSRTGYTGELGFEIYIGAAHAPDLWDAILAHPAVAPAGLGARDTLRLEMGYPLYGHELNTHTTPVEAGFAGMLDLDRDFKGAEALKQPPARTLVGLRFPGRRAVREGAVLHNAAGDVIGSVSSGSFSPSLGCGIALAYLDGGPVATGTPVYAPTGRSRLEGEVVKLPFYTQGTARSWN